MTSEQRARKDTDGAGDGATVYPPRPVVLAIDDEDGVRESLRLILGEEFEVLEAADGAAALAILGARRVDVALLDVRMPGEPGSKVLPRILAIDKSIPVILITADPHLRMAVDAMKAGVVDFIEKPFDDATLLNAVETARRRAAGEASRQAERNDIEARVAQLTGRERDVFDAIVAGESNKSAALKLGISPRTVEIYRANVMEKMRARTLSDLVRMALVRSGEN